MRDIIICTPGLETQFIEEATRLGYDELLILYEEKDAKQVQEVSSKEITINQGIISLSQQQGKVKNQGLEVALLGTRNVAFSKQVTLLLNNEFEPERDFVHQRRNGINHVILAQCKTNSVHIATGLATLRRENTKRQSVILGRMKQTMKLAEKKGVDYEVVSLARQPFEMRSARDVRAIVEWLK